MSALEPSLPAPKTEVAVLRGEDEPTRTTRRAAVRLLGGSAALAALIGARPGNVLAQGATPEAGTESKEGLYVVLRIRTVKAGRSIEELSNALSESLVPIIREIPGFVDYYIVQNFDTRERASVSIFRDKEGTDESTKAANDVIYGQGLDDYYENADPVVLEGTIVLAAN